MKKYKKLLLVNLTMLILLGSMRSYGQGVISGKVVDETNSPLPGASVTLKGTTSGTVSDSEGNYRLANVPSDAQVIVFSFIGYLNQEVTINNRTTINIQLQPDAEQLEEVVVVGYGTVEKKDVTGSMVSLNSSDLNSGIINSPNDLLQGRAAGVQVLPSSGEPGAGCKNYH